MDNSIRKIQNAQLQLLKLFIDICKRHHLRYYMIGGSLIGVLRHKGFIPWDDDIDLGMPRRDFDRFLALKNELPAGYSIICHETDHQWNFNLIQFVDKESEVIIGMNETPRRANLWIDIFPIDGVPGGKIAAWYHLKRIMWYRYLVQLAHVRTQVRQNIVERPWYERLILFMAHFISLEKYINTNKILYNMNKTLSNCDFDNMPYAGNLLGRKRERECVPQKWWGAPVFLPFEGIQVSCPAEADRYLMHIYGNYMALPPENKRESHDIEIIKLRK